MSKFPVIQQQDSMDCGPVCLAMICKFYGKYYPVSFLHNLCFITTEGGKRLRVYTLPFIVKVLTFAP